MSRIKSTVVENTEFVERFVEVCGTSKPAEIAELFDISYQAAKNYLAGRMPDTNVLISMSKNSSYSIHWLLTGEGQKFTDDSRDVPQLSGEMKTLISTECRKIVRDLIDDRVKSGKERIIVLRAEDIKEEKVIENNNPVSLNKA